MTETVNIELTPEQVKAVVFNAPGEYMEDFFHETLACVAHKNDTTDNWSGPIQIRIDSKGYDVPGIRAGLEDALLQSLDDDRCGVIVAIRDLLARVIVKYNKEIEAFQPEA
tara:strand:+ start:9700 stop:10032 length:333 start_codon:yes stop_codon:yes gene_type:complete